MSMKIVMFNLIISDEDGRFGITFSRGFCFKYHAVYYLQDESKIPEINAQAWILPMSQHSLIS